MMRVVGVLDIRPMTTTVDPSIEHGLPGCLAHGNILSRASIRDTSCGHSVEWVISIWIRMSEESSVFHILTMSQSYTTESRIPHKRIESLRLPMIVHKRHKVLGLGR